MVTRVDFSTNMPFGRNELFGSGVRPWMLSRALSEELQETVEAPLPERWQTLLRCLDVRGGSEGEGSNCS